MYPERSEGYYGAWHTVIAKLSVADHHSKIYTSYMNLTNPLWYQDPKIQNFVSLFSKEKLTKEEKSFKHEVLTFLKQNHFYIADQGYDWDKWRLPIDTAIIHHTSSSPTISLNELNILGLRLYINQYLTDADVKNQPLYSGHYWFGKNHAKENATFVSYHYLVRPSGKIIQLVDDKAYLWHAGNLEVNRRSIGIALAGKFIDKEPEAAALAAARTIIKDHKISSENIFGHLEVSKTKTECPGNLFLTSWKEKLFV